MIRDTIQVWLENPPTVSSEKSDSTTPPHGGSNLDSHFIKLAELHQKCFPNKPWSADDFADLKKSGCEIISSENGFIVWRAVLDEAEIITIGVNPESRGQGIASALLTLMENEIKKGINSPLCGGVGSYAAGGGQTRSLTPPQEGSLTPAGGKFETQQIKIFLEVAENNIPARKLYEKYGYKQLAVRKKYYDGIDAIIMEKDL
jgi:ribosomal-protein-alanine N-acetyltransferase